MHAFRIRLSVGRGTHLKDYEMQLKLLYLIAIFLPALQGLYAGEPEEDNGLTTGKNAWIPAQQTGLVKGSFVPRNRGINLPPNPKIMVIPVNNDTSKDDMIDEWQAQFIHRRLKAAERDKFDLIVLEIDSPGGDVLVTKQINDDLTKSKVPVVAFIKSKAMSCGAIMALACKIIIMEPHSEIGSAKAFSPMGDLATAVRQKLDAEMRAIMRDLCATNGYPPALAEGMVDSTLEVIETRDQNQRFMTGEEFQIESKRGATQVKIWKSKNQILTLTAEEARTAGIASGLASNMDEVALGLGVPGAQIVRMDISGAELVARFLSNPLWRWALVIIGLIALFIEMHSPGHGVGYAAFALCMGIFFWLQIFSNNAGLLELIMFGVGSVLVAVELFILPTFGALGFLGIALTIVSIVLAFLPEGMLPGLLGSSGKPSDYMMKQAIEGMEWATLTLLSIIGFFTVVWWKGIRMPGVSRIALETVNTGTIRGGSSSSARLHSIERGAQPHVGTKLSALVGLSGTAETMLRPAGKVRLEGATYDAVTEGDFIEPGTKILVLRTQGSALVVRSS